MGREKGTKTPQIAGESILGAPENIITEPEGVERGTGHFNNKALDDQPLSGLVQNWQDQGRTEVHQMIDLLINSKDKFLVGVAMRVDHLMYDLDRLTQAGEGGGFQWDQWDVVIPLEKTNRRMSQGYL